MSSHDIFRARVISDRVGIMRQGRILRMIGQDEIAHVNLEDLYLRYVEVEEEEPAATPGPSGSGPAA
jgi:ABC-type oligopeptide transport system ATPase subunit